jgi:GDPmannose 4,6-dehydratase
MQSKRKKALIVGISGQDGGYLARFLLQKGYQVFGTSRDAPVNKFENLYMLGIKESISIFSMSVVDFGSILQVITKIDPDEIYNLSGQTSVSLSFTQPVETNESISLGTLNLLEVIRCVNPKIKFYNAGSCEVFGDTGERLANEKSPFRPLSPYGVAKAAATMQVAVYRNAYGLNACTGILFNHESPLRPERFVTRKIVNFIGQIKNGLRKKLLLGNVNIVRDWGWAPDYVEAMWMMLQRENNEDYIIATGVGASLSDFLRVAFEQVDLDWKEFVEFDEGLARASDPEIVLGDPSRAANELGWRAQTMFPEVVNKLVTFGLQNYC